MRNKKLGINIPQMTFESRADDLVDLAGFTRLTEKVIWQAIENTGIPYEDWTMRKEVRETPELHLYLELKDGYVAPETRIAMAVHEQLKKLDKDYADLEEMLGLRPLKVTFLPSGAFKTFTSWRQAEGADLAHLKVPHINPSEKVLHSLLNSVAVKEIALKNSELEKVT